MSTTKEKIAVMQAFDEGKKVQSSRKGADAWMDATAPAWDWHSSDYRVKPEPRRFWLNVYGDDYAHVHKSKECADKGAGKLFRSDCECIEVVEVLHD